MIQYKWNIVRWGSMVIVLFSACAMGLLFSPRAAITADIQKVELNPGDVQSVPTNEPFRAGDERSLPVLKDILGTLKQIDGRLERIEKKIAEEKRQRQ